jgi:hypothetical protein
MTKSTSTPTPTALDLYQTAKEAIAFLANIKKLLQ